MDRELEKPPIEVGLPPSGIPEVHILSVRFVSKSQNILNIPIFRKIILAIEAVITFVGQDTRMTETTEIE